MVRVRVRDKIRRRVKLRVDFGDLNEYSSSNLRGVVEMMGRVRVKVRVRVRVSVSV